MTVKKTAAATPDSMPDEAQAALSKIKELAAAGEIELASDTLTAQLDAEIQEIFRALYSVHYGREPKRPIWTADGVGVGIILDYDPAAKDYSQPSFEACRIVGEQLAIELSPRTTWEVAALRLRNKRATQKS